MNDAEGIQREINATCFCSRRVGVTIHGLLIERINLRNLGHASGELEGKRPGYITVARPPCPAEDRGPSRGSVAAR